jgi:hypothetical protein
VQATVRSQVGRSGDQFLLGSHRRSQLEEERLSRPVVTDHEPDHRATIRDPVKVPADGGDLVSPADLNVGKSARRDNACAQ